MSWVWPLLIGCVFALLVGLVLDGVIPPPPKRLTNFPFKNLPGTNGALFALVVVVVMLVCAEMLYRIGVWVS